MRTPVRFPLGGTVSKHKQNVTATHPFCPSGSTGSFKLSVKGSSLVPQGQDVCVRCPLGLNAPMTRWAPMDGVRGHSEQYTWCTFWNGDQTERTSHAYKSCMWAWTKENNWFLISDFFFPPIINGWPFVCLLHVLSWFYFTKSKKKISKSFQITISSTLSSDTVLMKCKLTIQKGQTFFLL